MQRLLREGGGKLSDDIPPATEAERGRRRSRARDPSRAAGVAADSQARKPPSSPAEIEVARLRSLLTYALDELETLRGLLP